MNQSDELPVRVPSKVPILDRPLVVVSPKAFKKALHEQCCLKGWEIARVLKVLGETALPEERQPSLEVDMTAAECDHVVAETTL